MTKKPEDQTANELCRWVSSEVMVRHNKKHVVDVQMLAELIARLLAY